MSLDAAVRLQLGTLDLLVEMMAQPGEVVALLGPNGAGKSTMLRCLAGLQPIDTGHVIVDGAVLDAPDADVFIGPEDRAVGFVFQDYVLFEHMSVLDNVAYGLRARGGSRTDAHAVARDWLDRFGVDRYASDRPGSLSGGQSQRVALARALASAPRVLLLDEPLAALDVGTRATVRRDLREHLATFDGMSIVVTHDPLDAHALADRVVVLEQGRAVQTGTLSEIAARPRTRWIADLVGVNLIAGDVVDGVLTTTSGARVVIADAADGPSLATIRPHSVLLTREVPNSSARNTWRGTIVDIGRLGERVRIGIEGDLGLTAEITAGALDALALRQGDEVYASVKATDIEVGPA